MTVEELAKYLKLKPDTIYKKVRRGELPVVKLGKILRFPREKIDQWVEEQAQKTIKARDALTHKVDEVVDDLNRRAHTAQTKAQKVARDAQRVVKKVIQEDVPHFIEDVKKAPAPRRPAAIRKGLQEIWNDINQVTRPKKKAAGKGARKVGASRSSKKGTKGTSRKKAKA